MGDVKTLDEPSQFCYYLGRIPEIKERAACWSSAEAFPARFEASLMQVEGLKRAVEVCLHSKSFKTFLGLIHMILKKSSKSKGKTKVKGNWDKGMQLRYLGTV